ncbi:hypothetical protein D0T84_09395 [Dysgonomonas sp. 521]|uniref:acyltransferase family protein n=1 Tax=Dysgonomonas sp. 521 TaxID=2302932 RepID=UPI0013D77B5A|nr:acyltransferase family protein [Dysgonomonas sp. 521]NDV95133.1 hypothetical protein [Dysgonomonas sp. 521]
MHERNIALDYFKFFLAVLVITIHLYPEPVSIEWLIGDGIARIAVPCFFIINGYYLALIIENKEKFFGYLKKLIILYIVWMLIYSGFYYDDLFICSRRGIIGSVLLIFTGYWHLWYISALIGASVLLYLVKGYNKYLLLGISLILFVFGSFIYSLPLIDLSVFDGYSLFIVKYLYVFRVYLIRNFLFMGFPFVYIGWFLYYNKLKIGKLLNILLVTLFLLLLLFESYTLNGFKLGPFNEFSIGQLFPFLMDYRLSLFFICPLLMVYFINNPVLRNDDGLISKLASAVFFLHPLIISILDDRLNTYKSLFLVLFLSMIFGVVLIQLNKRIKIFL